MAEFWYICRVWANHETLNRPPPESRECHTNSDPPAGAPPSLRDPRRRSALLARDGVVTQAVETVVVIDDDASVREALESLLESVGLRVKLYGSASEFLSEGPPDGPTCLVLDVRLPGQGGLEFQRALAGTGVNLPIIFITGHGDIPMSVRAMKGGAIEFMTKPFRDQDLLDAIQSGLEQDRARREKEQAVALFRDRYNSLTPREREVMEQVVIGQLNKQIAGTIGLSEITVKVHRGSLMRKMGAKSLAELVLMAQRLKASGSPSG